MDDGKNHFLHLGSTSAPQAPGRVPASTAPSEACLLGTLIWVSKALLLFLLQPSHPILGHSAWGTGPESEQWHLPGVVQAIPEKGGPVSGVFPAAKWQSGSKLV